MSSAKAIEGRTTPVGQCRDRASERRPAALHERAYDHSVQGRRAHTFHDERVDLNIDAYYAYPHTSLENARWFASFLGDTGLQAPDVLNPLRGHRKSSEWSIVHKQE